MGIVYEIQRSRAHKSIGSAVYGTVCNPSHKVYNYTCAGFFFESGLLDQPAHGMQ